MKRNDKTYWRYVRHSFKGDISRIVAIVAIVALGIGFLVGLLSTTPDLYKTMDTYYDQANFADITIRSTIGFSNDTAQYIKDNVSDVKDVSLTAEKETYVDLDTSHVLARLIYRSFENEGNDLLTLSSGRYPKTENECVMLVGNNSLASYEIGSKLSYVENDVKHTFSIVGTVYDPNYIAFQAEQSYITGGTIEAIAYFDKNFYADLTYTNASVTFLSTEKMDCYSSEYENYIDNKITEISAISKEALDLRVEELHETIYEQALEASKQSIRESLSFLPDYLIDSIIESIIDQEWFLDLVKQNADEAFDELVQSMSPAWYVLNRDSITSAYVFKTDAQKVQTISLIFPPFFFLIAMLVSLSSISRIITKDRPIIGTFKALGFKKGKILTKYILYGVFSSLIGCILGVGIGLFALPGVLMFIYRSVYYLPVMSFVFTYGYVIGFSALMIGLVLLVVIGVVMTNLKEPAAQLMLGEKVPKPGKKILLEKIPFIWKHLKFKYKSMFRNIFRFKKNLLMMIIGIGGCSGMLLTGFGIQDSFNVIANDQYEQIIKYDAIVSVNAGTDPSTIFESNANYTGVIYQRGTVYKDETINVEIFGSDNKLLGYVGFYDTYGNEMTFNDDSVIISQQIADVLGVKANNIFQLDTDYGTKNVVITGVCQNYVSNYVYFGKNAYQRYFDVTYDNTTINAYIIELSSMASQEQDAYLSNLARLESVTSITATSATRETYDLIISNLSMVVLLITLLSGGLAAIVIYNLTDININERIREIATLRVIGYRRREVLMYIIREIFVMSLIGILIGLGIGVFLHWFIMINIGSIGLVFSTTINWSSYLLTIAISIVFVVAISLCFYPKIRHINMAESLKSVE